MSTINRQVQRDVARIDRPEIQIGMSDKHRLRPLVPPGDWVGSDPFLLLVEDWFLENVFDRHPHRGIETVTYVIAGAIEHYDNHGNKGRLNPGDVQWLTAGRGLIHNEQPADGQLAHILQLWVNLPSADKLVPARHQHLQADTVPVRREHGAEVRVFSGSSAGVTSPTKNYAPVTMVEIRLQPGARIEQDLAAGYNGFVVVVEGSGALGISGAHTGKGDLAWLTPCVEPSRLTLTGGDQGLLALLYAGKPLGEPVAARGPFVMNTDAELIAGFAEFRAQGEHFGL
ncbi:pirin family protein [Telluria aromaticivorans]|uniref:Pirin family protein n=1 Tax=Telluria aromaticivorans TaxID=2725995 RepID=A0A7Y2JYP7_9BURK|nr:pirin family protein [Telluria aromaticivorans]NNG22990.1 pirin family protein [Telluria aromaticivorans]